ncbi:MAG: twin-arginine translocation signal domain-containing protein, partial [Oscillospiraceae bacterium]|nr:twin-arginine translocation signal domain-containing protein [Oscillospiraceae bacterium]
MEKKLSRRDFLKGSAAGGASLAMAGLLAACTSKPDPTPTPSANNDVP